MNKKRTRRTFLKNTGLAGAALVLPTIVPSSVFGKTAPSNQINIGMIATGRQAIRVNLKQFLDMNNVRVMAVNDPDRWRMEQAENIINTHYGSSNKAYKGVSTYNDYRELLANKDVDAVMISSPDHWHVAQGIAAAQAGKHVAMEKALTICINHSKALIDAVAANNVHHRLDSEFRSMENFYTAVGLLRAGAIGKINKVIVGVPAPLNGSAPGPLPTMSVPAELDYDQWLGPAFPAPYTMQRVHEPNTYSVRPGWMRIDDYCNGMITNWGAHMIDVALWGIDKEYESPVMVEGTGTFTKGLWNTIESFNLNYTFADGQILEYIIDQPYVLFEGDKGWIKATFNKPLEASDEQIKKADVAPQYKNVVSDKEDFINAIIENKDTLEPLEVGHNVYRMCNMGLLSVQLGSQLQWDSKKDQLKDNNAANAMLYRPFRTKYLDKPVVDWLEKYQVM
jgi:predicted dehydrogenase